MYSAKLKILSVSDVQTVNSNNKELFVRMIFGTSGDKKIAFKAWNDYAKRDYAIDSEIDVEFKIESREHQGKYYTDLTILKIA